MYSTCGILSIALLLEDERERKAHLGESLNALERRGIDGAGEALELASLVDVVGLLALAGELADGVGERGIGGVVLELDNVLARDDLDAAGLDDRGALVDGCGRRQRQRQHGQESEREDHVDTVETEDLRAEECKGGFRLLPSKMIDCSEA